MTFFTDLTAHWEAMRARLGDGVEASQITQVIAALDDEAVLSLITEASAAVQAAEFIRIAAAGVAAARSGREQGHSGLAQTQGHRSPVALVQELTGSSRSDAAKHIRLGEALLAMSGSTPDESAASGESGDDVPEENVGADGIVDGDLLPPETPWHAPLGQALAQGRLTADQHDAILRGLGEPPTGREGDLDGEEAKGAWSLAAEQFVTEAGQRTLEELRRAARAVRDQLDPLGAEERYRQRFESRSFRQWTDEYGQHRISMALDDHAALWITAAVNAALRPRRGGPRFVDAEEKAQAEQLARDPRSNDQLAYDLIIDILRAGMLADEKAVFGARQAGVRLLITREAHGDAAAGKAAVGVAEDDGTTLPAWLIAQHACESGITQCALDREGNPLYLGREQRLFSAKQRLALAIRDGGCRWRGCDRPASYCEAHHIDQYARDGGRTDIDRGILLCRFHHMQLHHGGWRITRDGLGDFLLHPPGGDPIALAPRLARRYVWGEVEPPPRRFRLAA